MILFGFAGIPAEQWLDAPTLWLLGAVLLILATASVVGRFLGQQSESTVNPALVRLFALRVRAWWMMCAILIAGFLFGYMVTVILFGVVSFMALREFITMTPTRRSDHRALFWVFFVVTPLQYFLVSMVGEGDNWYLIFSVFIPVYGSLLIPTRIALSGDPKWFLERSAKIQYGLLICVYALSYAPALLGKSLQMPDADGKLVPWSGSPAGLLFYFVLLVQLNDVFQYGWGKLVGKHMIAPKVNSNRTWEGFCGGVASTTIVGVLLCKVTPFGIWGSAFMAMIVAVMGCAGGIVMSAIKRDRGVEDYGTLVQGHHGLLDRIDSLCFSAPVFFHLTPVFAELAR